MVHIINIKDETEKSIICNHILRKLPDWFGIESAIVEYAEGVKDTEFYAAFYKNEPIGFTSLKRHNPYTYEIFVMGILEKYHHKGIGKMLMESCEKHCIKEKADFLTVKTLDSSRENESYDKTRKFYYACGFRPLEVFPLMWRKDNPCLFMAKGISRSK